MSIPIALRQSDTPARGHGPGRPAGALVLTALLLAVCAAVLGRPGDEIALGLAVAALAAASLFALRAAWLATGDRAPARRPVAVRTAPLAEPLSEDALSEQLRLLNDLYVEKVNQAVDDDRPDLARELSDAYADDALRLMAAAGRPPEDLLPAA